jgi:hypothetical protein
MKEITRRLNLGNGCYHSVQNLLSSHLLSKNIKISIHKTIILPVVLYECRTWSLAFRPKREVMGELRNLHNEELHNLYSSQSIIRMIKSRVGWDGHVARMVETRNAYRILVGKSEVKSPLERPRHRWVDNIEIDLREIGWAGMDWIDLA